MTHQHSTADQRSTINDHPWPHRLAWLVACGVFPLIWMGGLVTTEGAGMAVPDWPTTYQSWFYPLQKWIWKTSSDLFLEHGHRTLAQVVGLLSIFLLVAVFRSEPRRSVRWLSVVILGGLLFQGTLGGFRVLWDERLLARIHGCTAPIVFCLCTLMVTLTSKAWKARLVSRATPRIVEKTSKSLSWLAPSLVALIYVEIVFGTLLRHPLVDAWTSWSLVWIWSKVIAAGVLVVGVVSLLFLRPTAAERADFAIVRRRISIFALLFVLQITLACTTWVVNYGWPKWFTDNVVNWTYTVVRGGWLQVWITTAHSAIGPLVLAAAFNMAVWSRSNNTALPRR